MKPSSRACRYCKSPARGNPCWYFLDHPEYAVAGTDPPCIEEQDYVQRIERRKRRRHAWSIFFVVVILASAGGYLLFR